MESVERLLPNGFHDGVLRGLSVNYRPGTLSLDVDFWIGNIDDEQCEVYGLGRVTISGLEFLVSIPMLAPMARFLAGDDASSPVGDDAISMRAYRASAAHQAFVARDWNVSSPPYYVPDDDSSALNR